MFAHHRLLVRACALLVGLNLLSAGVAAADPSDCTEWAWGGQTGDLYHLVGQSEVTETQTYSLDAGVCGLGAEGTVTYTETYNVGTYQNTSTGAQVQVNCSTGQVIS